MVVFCGKLHHVLNIGKDILVRYLENQAASTFKQINIKLETVLCKDLGLH